jgi:hypothetical protein
MPPLNAMPRLNAMPPLNYVAERPRGTGETSPLAAARDANMLDSFLTAACRMTALKMSFILKLCSPAHEFTDLAAIGKTSNKNRSLFSRHRPAVEPYSAVANRLRAKCISASRGSALRVLSFFSPGYWRGASRKIRLVRRTMYVAAPATVRDARANSPACETAAGGPRPFSTA